MLRRLFADGLKGTLLRNSFIVGIWWVIFYPGFYSADSFAVMNMARTGQLNSAWSAPWAIFVRIFSIGGRYPGIVTLLGVLLLASSMTVFCYAIFRQQVAAITSSILVCTPLVGAMGITMWHDIPMTSGFLLIMTFLIRSSKNGVQRQDFIWLLFPGAFFITFRLNGIPTLLLFAFVYFIMRGPRDAKKFLALGIALSFVVTLLANLAIGESPAGGSPIALGWMQYDISCFASTPAGQGFVEKAIPGIGSTETWQSKSACNWFSDAKLSQTELDKSQKHLSSAWMQLFVHHPFFILNTHVKRNEYLVPVPIYGLPKPPFLQSNIEFQGQGIAWAFPKLAEKARIYIRAWNFGRSFFAYSGLWFLVLFISWLRTRRNDLLLLVLLSAFLTLGLFVAAGISDGRYALFTLIAGQAVAIGFVADWILQRRKIVPGKV